MIDHLVRSQGASKGPDSRFTVVLSSGSSAGLA